MRPQVATETDAQRVQREAAERNNITATQDYLRGQTRHYQKLQKPRLSLVTGRLAPAGILSSQGS